MARYEQSLISASLGGVGEPTTVALFALHLESDTRGDLHLERVHLRNLWRSKHGQRFREIADLINAFHRRVDQLPRRASLAPVVVADITASSVVLDELAGGIRPACVRIVNGGQPRKDERGQWRIPRPHLMDKLAVEIEEAKDERRVLAAALDGEELDLYRRAFTDFRKKRPAQTGASADLDASRVNDLDDVVWAVGVGFWWATERHRPTLSDGPATALTDWNELRPDYGPGGATW